LWFVGFADFAFFHYWFNVSLTPPAIHTKGIKANQNTQKAKMTMHFVVRGPQGVFPTHDPEGFPLPEYRGMWHRPFCCLPIGAFILIVGCILYSQVKTAFIGMIVAGALLIGGSILTAIACKLSGERNLRKWELENPEAAAALEARGGYDAIPLVSFETARQQNMPNQQSTAVVQVMVVQQPNYQQGQPNLPPTSHLHQQPQLYNGAPVLQNGNLFYPQPGRPGEPPAGPTVVTTTMVAAGTTYYYKPDFRGQRLTFEQMFGVRPGGVVQPESTLVPVDAPKPPIVYGSERMQQQYGASAPSSAAIASPPASGILVVPGFGLQA
jgi:hypothetical protein